MSVGANYQDLDPALYRALSTGSVSSKVGSILYRAVDIRPRWPSHMYDHSDSIVTRTFCASYGHQILSPLHASPLEVNRGLFLCLELTTRFVAFCSASVYSERR